MSAVHKKLACYREGMHINTAPSSTVTQTRGGGLLQLLMLMLWISHMWCAVEQGSRQPLSCHPQCRGTRSTKLDMITYKRVMLPALRPLNLRCTLHRIKVNTEPLLRASEVGRCENTTRVTRFLSFPSS